MMYTERLGCVAICICVVLSLVDFIVSIKLELQLMPHVNALESDVISNLSPLVKDPVKSLKLKSLPLFWRISSTFFMTVSLGLL